MMSNEIKMYNLVGIRLGIYKAANCVALYSYMKTPSRHPGTFFMLMGIDEIPYIALLPRALVRFCQ